MRTRTILATVIGLTSIVWPLMPARAHHAFSAEFDANKPVDLSGTVTKVEWVNPHSWIHIDVKGPDGKAETWMIEAGSPNVLLRRGLNKNLLLPGTEIRVRGFQVKSGAKKANGGNITLPGGRTVLLSTPGTGAPDVEQRR